MSHPIFVWLTIPGLRKQDLAQMPGLAHWASQGQQIELHHHFPAVTWPAQANQLTGALPSDHGVVANGFYWREKNEVEMWTAWNHVIETPQIWDRLKAFDPSIVTAAWFPMLSKGCHADHVCMPAPIHQPDGSEDLWCYTKPQEFYGELLENLGHFPLQHFWGPMANLKSSQWILDSALLAAEKFAPNFFYIYLPHLDYAAQKFGPNSEQAIAALGDLDGAISKFASALSDCYAQEITWLANSEYTISEVDHVCYPNRILREAGFLRVTTDEEGREQLDFANSSAWALVDHQFSHVFVSQPKLVETVTALFAETEGIERALSHQELSARGMGHSRSGEVVLVSRANSWQAYYWWLDDKLAPPYAGNVDIHRKPGYDPVEMFFDMKTKSVPLDATLIKGSHGRGIFPGDTMPPDSEGVLVCNRFLDDRLAISDLDIAKLVEQQFQAKPEYP